MSGTMLNTVNLKEVEKLANQLGNDLEKVQRELKRIQSIKCRLKKQKGKKTYEQEMSETLKYEQLLKEVRSLLSPKKKPVTQYTLEDVEKLDYDETIKAIRSIQSKKTLTRWLTPEEGNNEEFKKACEIEKMLIEHREKIKPVDETYIRKTDLIKIIETIESSGELSQERIIELLRSLL